MRIDDVQVRPMPRGFRASARVTSAGGPNGELWFEVSGGAVPPPPEMAASAMLAAGFPTAVWREEDLEVASPVDAELRRRLPVLARGSGRLHVRSRTIAIHAEAASSPPRPDRLVGASFSGGVDSFYTLQANLDPASPRRVGALVTGLGFDSGVDDAAVHARLAEGLGAVSSELGLRHFFVRTNFKPFFRPYADWNRVTHGASLIAFAFLLAGELRTYLIPASAPIDRLYRWGTHALLDSAWTSGHVDVATDGWDIHRNDKLVAIADWPLAMRSLRVCARNKETVNCGRCEKCLRTMALLELAHRGDVPAFPRRLDAASIRWLKVKEVRELYWWDRMRREAKRDPELAWLATSIGQMAFLTRMHAPRRRLQNWLRSGRRKSLDPIDF